MPDTTGASMVFQKGEKEPSAGSLIGFGPEAVP